MWCTSSLSTTTGCNRCFELDFSNSVGYATARDVGSKRLAAAGKRMIVQTISTGEEFPEGMFALLVPGGGDNGIGCLRNWGLQSRPEGYDIGLPYGGMLSSCQGCVGSGLECVPDPNIPHEQVRACVKAMCNRTFGGPDYPHLHGLHTACDDWFADWFEAADQPTMRYREVGCPAEIGDALYYSGREGQRVIDAQMG